MKEWLMYLLVFLMVGFAVYTIIEWIALRLWLRSYRIHGSDFNRMKIFLKYGRDNFIAKRERRRLNKIADKVHAYFTCRHGIITFSFNDKDNWLDARDFLHRYCLK